MAARLNRRHQELVIQKIKTSQLINRLQDHAFGKIDLTDGQRDSIKFLINKAIPNPPTEMNVGGPVGTALLASLDSPEDLMQQIHELEERLGIVATTRS